MATQIASTPVVKGQEAIKIYAEANKLRTPASKRGADKLTEKFSKKVRNK